MKRDAKTDETKNAVDLTERYRPVGLGAVRAAYSVGPARKAASIKDDASARLLLPEHAPD
ncbi:hypothetical protein GCM10010520_13360 [Rhizobium viscosum]|uniref:Uncharacterized protein n=1 Tax=Rhizobium viscosum TaxID=1673 RepID=A0ABR9IZB0_RHIVS|nr:hypothetical protein [Rhizobium viscosum]